MIIHGDCVEEMAKLAASGQQFASIITDPPYHLTEIPRTGSRGFNRTRDEATQAARTGFMGKTWDGGDVAFRPETWERALDLLEPGGMLAAFGGARTQHRMACAIEDAGFEIRDCALWLYGTGFPKSKSQLKPAYEPIILAKKPGPLRPLAIDACRVPAESRPLILPNRRSGNQVYGDMLQGSYAAGETTEGRYPANILHDGSDEVLDAFAAFGERRTSAPRDDRGRRPGGFGNVGHSKGDSVPNSACYGDSGTAARFFYCAKASKSERAGTTHPTVKPLSLMRWIVRLVTPPGGAVLDPFAGSGTTGLACLAEGFEFVLIEREEEYIAEIQRRLAVT